MIIIATILIPPLQLSLLTIQPLAAGLCTSCTLHSLEATDSKCKDETVAWVRGPDSCGLACCQVRRAYVHA